MTGKGFTTVGLALQIVFELLFLWKSRNDFEMSAFNNTKRDVLRFWFDCIDFLLGLIYLYKDLLTIQYLNETN